MNEQQFLEELIRRHKEIMQRSDAFIGQPVLSRVTSVLMQDLGQFCFDCYDQHLVGIASVFYTLIRGGHYGSVQQLVDTLERMHKKDTAV